MLRLLSSPDRTTSEGFADYIALLVLYATGLHVSKLSALNIEDVDLKESWVHVQKGKGRDRQVALLFPRLLWTIYGSMSVYTARQPWALFC